MSAPAIRVALVGCGDIGETQHLPALVRDGRFAVVGVADPDPAGPSGWARASASTAACSTRPTCSRSHPTRSCWRRRRT